MSDSRIEIRAPRKAWMLMILSTYKEKAKQVVRKGANWVDDVNIGSDSKNTSSDTMRGQVDMKAGSGEKKVRDNNDLSTYCRENYIT